MSYRVVGTDLLSWRCCAIQPPANTVMWLRSPQFPFYCKNESLTSPLCVNFWPQKVLAVLPNGTCWLLLHHLECQDAAATTSGQKFPGSAPQISFGARMMEGREGPSMPHSPWNFTLSKNSYVIHANITILLGRGGKYQCHSRFKQYHPSQNMTEENSRHVLMK